jgi:hypothetical protein
MADREQIALQARALLTERGEAAVGFTVPRLMALVPLALKALAQRVAYRADYEDMQADFAVTPVAGVFTLDDSILAERVTKTGELVIGGAAAKAHETFDALTARWPKDLRHYCVTGRQVHIRELTTGALGTCVTPGVLTASRIPTLAQLLARYDAELAADTAALALARMKEAAG